MQMNTWRMLRLSMQVNQCRWIPDDTYWFQLSTITGTNMCHTVFHGLNCSLMSKIKVRNKFRTAISTTKPNEICSTNANEHENHLLAVKFAYPTAHYRTVVLCIYSHVETRWAFTLWMRGRSFPINASDFLIELVTRFSTMERRRTTSS